MASILTPEDVVRRIAAECTLIDERGAVSIRLKPAAAIVCQYGEQFRWPRPKCRKDSPAAALRLPRRASPPHWPFHVGQAYRVRSRLAAGGRWIRTSGSRARSEP